MSPFYTKTGDDGYTSVLGEGRLPKHDPRIEAVGNLDEASAALGLARSSCHLVSSTTILLQAQRDLYGIMAEVAATPENVLRFRSIGAERVAWLEKQVDGLSDQVELPEDFIVPGDTPAGAALSLGRTVVRRAERSLALLINTGILENTFLLQYLNRLSSLCFVLELSENQASGAGKPTLAKDHPA